MIALPMTPEDLVRATGCRFAVATEFAEPLSVAAVRWGIDSQTSLPAWVAQMAHESMLFTRTEESLYYSSTQRLISVWPSRFRLPAPGTSEESMERFADGKSNPLAYIRQPRKLAEFVYGGRMENRPEGSGDGWMFRGRGLKHVTGARNYKRYQAASGIAAVIHPELLAVDRFVAADSAGWYWSDSGAGRFADAGDILAVTVAINGGTLGLKERIELTKRAMEALA